MIPEKLYKQILDVLPILCVDIVIRNKRGEYLLVKRSNEPLKGEWWVIGGRVLKGEKLSEAAARKIRQELSLSVSPDQLTCLGYYEDIYDKNSFAARGGLHTLGIVFGMELESDRPATLDNQSDDVKYCDKLPERLIIKPFTGGRFLPLGEEGPSCPKKL